MSNILKPVVFFWKSTLLTFSFLLIFESAIFSAPKKRGKNKDEATVQQQEENSSENSSEGVRLPANTKPRTYFYKIEQEILDGVEYGSPDSIRLAMSKLRKNDTEYSENEKVLMNIAASLMEILWPSEKITWETFEIQEDNTYTGAIKSVKNGVFDSSTGNVDFLATALPVLVIFTQNINPNIYEQCEASVESIINLKPDSVLSNYLAGSLYQKEGKFIQAEKYLQAAYEKIPNNLEIILAYTDILVKNKKSAVASQVMATIPATYSENLMVLKQRAFVAFNNKEYSSAENYVAKVLQQTPNDLEFLLFRARIFIEKNDYIHASSLLDVYARQNDTNIDYLVLRARFQLDWSKNTTAATGKVDAVVKEVEDFHSMLLI